MSILRDMCTHSDNTTYDMGRILCLLSFIVFYCIAIGSLFTAAPWDAIQFSGGISAMAISFGIHQRLKRKNK
jgi:hypothetical protein